jgi:DNA-binding response OmpR family regulator
MRAPFEDETDDFADDEVTSPGSRTPRARVLVAEDDADLRGMIADQLRREGFDVLEASSGDDALEVLAAIGAIGDPQGGVDLLVMDVRMPGTSGIEVTRILRLAHWTTPVLWITAFPESGLLIEAPRLAAKVLAKPFALAQLSEAAIAALLGQDRDGARHAAAR